MRELALEAFQMQMMKLVSFLPEEIQFYMQQAEYVEYKKKEYLLKKGEVENYLYFIYSGIVRVYFPKEDREICIDFGFPNSLICSFISFENRKPSDISIQTITPVKVIRFTKELVERFNSSSKNSERLTRITVGALYSQKVKKEMMLLSQNAEEHYLYLIKKHPEVTSNIPVKDIASYLGILPESLSRIRKKINN